jgi:hypothetical protein
VFINEDEWRCNLAAILSKTIGHQGICEANARLIAAAPDLVAALEDLISRFVKCAVASGTDPEFAEAAVEKHRAALVKATESDDG